MSDQDGKQALVQQRPATKDKEAWKTYWQAQNQWWRTEPQIDSERQKFLAERRALIPDIEQGIYPFKDIKLSRADIEWLLATHENGRGPIDWTDDSQRVRLGVDLRGVYLCEINLSYLPLARIQGSLTTNQWRSATQEQRNLAGIRMRKVDLKGSHLEGAHLRFAKLEEVDLRFVYLDRTHLRETYLKKVDLRRANFDGARLEHANLYDERGISPDLADAEWGKAKLGVADWSKVLLLGDEHQARQKFDENGKLKDKDTELMEHRRAMRANRQIALALRAEGLNEEAARFAYHSQKLQRIVLWRQAFQPGIGLLQRLSKFGSAVFSLFLDLLAGYGYHPVKTLLWYLLVIFGFATCYFLFGHLPPLPDALVFSFMSFHGRGFFPALSSETNLHNPLVILAAAEAVLGLLIEISLISTFTQRFFGK